MSQRVGHHWATSLSLWVFGWVSLGFLVFHDVSLPLAQPPKHSLSKLDVIFFYTNFLFSPFPTGIFKDLWLPWQTFMSESILMLESFISHSPWPGDKIYFYLNDSKPQGTRWPFTISHVQESQVTSSWEFLSLRFTNQFCLVYHSQFPEQYFYLLEEVSRKKRCLSDTKLSAGQDFSGCPWAKFSDYQSSRYQSSSVSGKTPWRRKQQPTPVFLPGESHRQRSLAGYSSFGVAKSQICLSD